MREGKKPSVAMECARKLEPEDSEGAKSVKNRNKRGSQSDSPVLLVLFVVKALCLILSAPNDDSWSAH